MIELDAEVAADDFAAAIDELRGRGFALRMIMPADDPALARLDDGELAIRLIRDGYRPAVDADPAVLVPRFEVTRLGDAGWVTGRAGMLYRDLLPSRQGGRFVASHIRIRDAGPVPDDVHYHRIRFQLIFCVAGWVRLVYEGQGSDFVLAAGDCVLQPPGIRHRVLECSAGLEVVEVTCPAVHETWLDDALTLPSSRRDDVFDGQRFVHHRADGAVWTPWRADGFECRDTGIGEATGGIAGAGVVRAAAANSTPVTTHDGELQWWFVLGGRWVLVRPGEPDEPLGPGDAVAVPAGMPHTLRADEAGSELLEVTVPAAGTVASSG